MQFGLFKPQQQRTEGRVFIAQGLQSPFEPGRHAHFEDEVIQDYDANNEAELKFSAPKTEVAESPRSSAISTSAKPSHSTAVTDEEIFRVAERLAWKPRPDNQPEGSEPDLASIRITGGGNQLVNFVTDPTLRLHDGLAQGMRLEIDFSDEEEASVYFHEGIELLSYLRNQLAALPELKDLSPKADLSTANIGEPGITTAEMKSQVRIILERHHSIFLGNGNALIEYSDSEWESPIVIVMKKNGVDIRLCIDYRLVDQLIKLMHHPLPLIDDLLIGFENNCRWGFACLPASEESRVDTEVLALLGINVESSVEHDLTAMAENITVLQRDIPAPPQLNPTWEQMCEDLDRLLYRLRYWGISVSLPKSEFGKRTISYLFHEIGAEGIRAKPKIAKGVMDLPFPSTLKGVQSFLGSLNYYNKFIEDLSVIASVLYELTDEQVQAGRDLSRAKEAFEVLKPCAVLDQEHGGVILPVRFTGRVLNDQELRYHPAEKAEVASAFKLGFGSVARCGSCACLAYVHEGTVHVANAGDIRAVLGKSGKDSELIVAEPLSNDQNAMVKFEQEKLIEEHPGEANVFTCRHPDSCYVKGALQPTRAFGDFSLKHPEFNGPPYVNGDRSAGRHFAAPFTPPYITAIPEVKSHKLQEGDKFLIIGSDGLWDYLSNEEAVEVVNGQASCGNHDLAGRALVERVLQKAAKRYGMTYQELLSLPPGSHRAVAVTMTRRWSFSSSTRVEATVLPNSLMYMKKHNRRATKSTVMKGVNSLIHNFHRR
ncbi:hypothetical protein ON010_g5790 [Phytophthora cinnamomi]|nr:hypothetical protein ON010_g5790 [Phytophthora cinnamomi]